MLMLRWIRLGLVVGENRADVSVVFYLLLGAGARGNESHRNLARSLVWLIFKTENTFLPGAGGASFFDSST